MCEVIRQIHPIGQGAFYTETFFVDNKSFSVVYDCGSYWDGLKKKFSNVHPLKGVIDDFINKRGRDVKFIFISHFHADHINGIKYLLNCINNGVKIYLPWMNRTVKLFYFIENIYEMGGINNVEEEYSQWLYDLFFGNAEYKYELLSEEDYENENSQKNVQRCARIDIIESYPLWEYIPFVYNDKGLNGEVELFMSELFGKKIVKSDYDSLISILRDDWERIEKLVSTIRDTKDGRKICGNNTSLMLYSGPRHFDLSWIDAPAVRLPRYPYHCDCCRMDRKIGSGCLYVGDMMTAKAYEYLSENMPARARRNIGLLQLSHHGDDNEMNNRLVDLCIPNAFCCFGTKNTYHHPEWNTINEHLISGANVFPINEQTHRGLIQRIDLD